MRHFSRSAALLLLTFLMVGIGVAAGVPPPAQAAPIGGLIVIPGSGSDLTAIRLRTSGGCPARADAYYARMRGQGFPADGQVVTANTSAGMSHSFGFDVFFLQIMRDYAVRNHAALGGHYDITVFCVDSFTLQDYGEFAGSLVFTSPTHYDALGAAKPIGPPPSVLALAGDGSALPPGSDSATGGVRPEPPAAAPSAAAPPQPAGGAAPAAGQAAGGQTGRVSTRAASDTARSPVPLVVVAIVLVALLTLLVVKRFRRRGSR